MLGIVCCTGTTRACNFLEIGLDLMPLNLNIVCAMAGRLADWIPVLISLTHLL